MTLFECLWEESHHVYSLRRDGQHGSGLPCPTADGHDEPGLPMLSMPMGEGFHAPSSLFQTKGSHQTAYQYEGQILKDNHNILEDTMKCNLRNIIQSKTFSSNPLLNGTYKIVALYLFS